jgi:hypothetical protein
VLSHDEQEAWDQIRRRYAQEAEEPAPGVLDPTVRRSRSSRVEDLPAAVVAGGWGAIVLVIFGALVAGLAIAFATALGWLLWRHWPLLAGDVRRSARSASRDATIDGAGYPSSEEPRHRRIPGTT